ncbi:hypothetical protein ADEAN_000798900 [Angomonas deanei]|uniref:Uncharacterized protein n=1 Tax=Angomonas deanei TaxID=59799 RepID=A0A7G2CN19_9TRYP|nr:hypothetical protein ADEAN_000798900 [Angomonas deanei]
MVQLTYTVMGVAPDTLLAEEEDKEEVVRPSRQRESPSTTEPTLLPTHEYNLNISSVKHLLQPKTSPADRGATPLAQHDPYIDVGLRYTTRYLGALPILLSLHCEAGVPVLPSTATLLCITTAQQGLLVPMGLMCVAPYWYPIQYCTTLDNYYDGGALEEMGKEDGK